jgi:hypothetical protein
MTTRRHVLSLLAAAPALSACGGRGDLPDPAAAWRDPGAAEEDPRRFALAHAILAPNPHNTQAWQVALDGGDGMTLYCDLERRLPFTDPFDRQITIGCGCFLELYALAARERGHRAQITPFPDGEPPPRLDERAIAHVQLIAEPPAVPNDGFAQITQRRTNRNVYDGRVPPEDVLQGLIGIAGGQGIAGEYVSDAARVAALRDLVWRAFDRELRTRGAQEETYNWLRFGEAEVAAHRDGLAIDAPMAPLLKSLGFLDRDDFLNPESMANKQAAEDWRAKAESAPAFLWIRTVGDSALERLEAGQVYARINLAATAAGLAMHPWSQALQEYEEMAELRAEARRLLDAGDETVQMLARVGYAEPVGPAARRGVDAVLRG